MHHKYEQTDTLVKRNIDLCSGVMSDQLFPGVTIFLFLCQSVEFVVIPIVGRLRKKSCTLGYKYDTWYNYSLRNATKNWKGTQACRAPL